MTIRRLWFLPLALIAMAVPNAYCQQTVFDVPSADILEKGKVYGELDGTVHGIKPIFETFTPRVVVGIGHRIEIGMNFDGLSTPVTGQLEVSPTIKWGIWRGKDSGWSVYAGDDLFFPVRKRSYNAGNYVYAMVAKEWKHGTRIGIGAYDFTRNVVTTGNCAGGQFTFEQTINKRLTLAAEWYTGKSATGYVNPGVIVKVTSKLTLYGAYQIGNSGVTAGNHQFLYEIGYNFN